MLILSRHRDEQITIGDDIVVTVVDIHGDKVRLGIDAPPEVPVHRLEVYRAILHERVADLMKLYGERGITERQCEVAIVASKFNMKIARDAIRAVLEENETGIPPTFEDDPKGE